VTRLEVPVRSPIAFSRALDSDSQVLTPPAETAGVECDGRLFVWHVVPPDDDPVFGGEAFGPTVTVVAADAEVAMAADDLQRFLSALAFWLDAPVEAVSYGASGECDPFHRAVLRTRQAAVVSVVVEPPDGIVVCADPNARLALACYREALNAGSPFYRFLAFWNCLDAAFNVDRDARARNSFIDANAPRFEQRAWDVRYPFPQDPAKDLEQESRHAIAHVLRQPGHRMLHPDSAADREQLHAESRLLQWLARGAIDYMFPAAVNVGRRSHT
jgi:hypothetical protein